MITLGVLTWLNDNMDFFKTANGAFRFISIFSYLNISFRKQNWGFDMSKMMQNFVFVVPHLFAMKWNEHHTTLPWSCLLLLEVPSLLLLSLLLFSATAGILKIIVLCSWFSWKYLSIYMSNNMKTKIFVSTLFTTFQKRRLKTNSRKYTIRTYCCDIALR